MAILAQTLCQGLEALFFVVFPKRPGLWMRREEEEGMSLLGKLKLAFALKLTAASGLYAAQHSQTAQSRWNATGCVFETAAAQPKTAAVVQESRTDLDKAKQTWGNEIQTAKILASRDASPSFSFSVVGDAEPGRFPWQRVFAPGKDGFARLMRMIQGQDSRFTVQLGDFVSKGTDENYEAHVAYLNREVKTPILHVLGNHDRSTPNGPADKTFYRKVFGISDFTFDYGNYRFVILDTSDLKLTGDQLTWLKAVLQTDKRKLIFTHVPPKPLDGQIQSYDLETQAPLISPGYFTDGAKEFTEIASQAKVERVYMGHIHAFGVAQYKGVTYVLTGGGGSPLYPLPPGYPNRKFTHYIRVEANETGLKETVYTLDGRTFPLLQTLGLASSR